MRVLHIYSGNLYGGVETFLRTLARNPPISGRVAMEFALCFEGRLARELRDAGARLHMLGAVRMRSPRSVLGARRSLARLMKSESYDAAVCHSAWPHALFAPEVRRSRTPLAHYMHDIPNPLGWLDRLANRTPPDRVLCNGTFTANSGEWFFRAVPRSVVRLPVEVAALASATERAELRRSIGGPKDGVVILQASRMQHWKGQSLLIDALGKLRDEARWICWIAGGAQRPREVAYERSLMASARRLGIDDRVRFLGQRDDVRSLMSAADIYCQLNVAPEPFGLVFVEALSAGLPIVATRIGGAVEIIPPSCGALVSLDASTIADALRELIRNDERRKTLSSAGPLRARELCDVQQRVGELADVLLTLDPVGERRRPEAVEARGTP